MGSGGSVEALAEDEVKFDLTCQDVNTPRGDTAKAEVKRLRNLLISRTHKAIQAVAMARFNELDVDKSGFLENEELIKVTDWVVQYFGDKLGSNTADVKKKIMLRLDVNQDGKLDPEEFQALFDLIVERVNLLQRAKVKFEEFDSDKSGFLETAEIDAVLTWTLQAFPADDDVYKYKEKLLKDLDANGDGKLDLKEFTELFEQMLVRTELINRARSKFGELDADKSGMLEMDELDKVTDWVLQAYAEKSQQERSDFKANLIKRMDVNGDGKLSLQEFAVIFDEIVTRMELTEKAKVEFQKLDKDGSGFLEKNELEAVLKTWATLCGAQVQIDPSASIDEMMSKLDANSDGKLSLAEFIPLFDGVVSTCGIWNIIVQ